MKKNDMKIPLDIINEYNLPKPISFNEARGKIIDRFITGWIKKGIIITFTDGTAIYIYGDEEEGDFHIYGDNNSSLDNYITYLGYNVNSQYHNAYEELCRREEKLSTEEYEQKEFDLYQELKKKFGKKDEREGK